MANLNAGSVFSAPSFGKTVFVDTNLGTHLVTLLHSGDTVSSFKKKLLEDHRICFPDVGDIEVSALKVKRKGHFYHLSDSMFVTKAFDGISKSWFLFLEARKVAKEGENRQLQCVDSSQQVKYLTDGIEPLLDAPYRRLPGTDELNHELESDNQLVKYKSSVFLSGADKELLTDFDMAAEHSSGHHPEVCYPDTDTVVENVAAECQDILAAADPNSSDPKLLEKENYIATTSAFADRSTENEINAVQQVPNLEEHAGTESAAVVKRTRKSKRQTRISDDRGVEGTHGPSVVSELTSANIAHESTETNADKETANVDDNVKEVKAAQKDPNIEEAAGTERATTTERTPKYKRKIRSSIDHGLEGTDGPSVVPEPTLANNGHEITESNADKASANVDGNVNEVKAVLEDQKMVEAAGTELATTTKRTRKIKRKIRSSDDHGVEGTHGPSVVSELTLANSARENTESKADKADANVGSYVNGVNNVQKDGITEEAAGAELATITKRTRKPKRKTRSSDDHAPEETDGPSGVSALISPNNAHEKTERNADKASANVDGSENLEIEHRVNAAPVAIEPSVIASENVDFQVNSIEAGRVGQHENNENVMENAVSVKETSSLQTPARKKRRVEKKPRKEDSIVGSVESMLNTNKNITEPDAFSLHASLADKPKDPNFDAPEIANDHLEAISGLTASPSADKKKKRKKSSKDPNKSAAAATTSSRDVLDSSHGVYGNADGAMVGSDFCAISPRKKLDEPLITAMETETEMCGKNGNGAVGSSVAILGAAENLQTAYSTITPLPLVQKSKKPDLIEIHSDQNIGGEAKDATPVLEAASLGTFTTKDDSEAAPNRHNNELNADEAKGVKSSKQKRKSKKVKNPVEDTPVISGAQRVEGSGIGISSAEPIKATDGEGPDSVIRSVLESLHQDKENEENLEKAEKKSRKKTKRKQPSDGVDGLGLSVQESIAAMEAPAPMVSVDNLKEMVDSSKPLKKVEPRINSAVGQSSRTILEFENDNGIESVDPLLSKKNSEVHDLPQDTMLHKLCVDDDVNPSSQAAFVHEKEEVDIGDNFGSTRTEHDIVANGTEAAEPIAKSNKKKKKKKIPDVLPEGSIDGSGSMKPSEKRVSTRGAQPASSSTSQQPSKAKNESGASLQNKNLQNPGTGAIDAASSKLEKTPKALVSDTVDASTALRKPKTMEEACPTSVKGTKNKKEAVKSFFSVPVNRNNLKDGKKVAFPVAGAIFDNSNSDEDDEPKGSGASTRTPSDASSDYTDEDSDATFLSQKLGSRVFGGEGDGETNGSSGRGDMSLEKILRSSSRFKKAKLIASQSQPDSFDDDESQPFDCVPDSQAT